MGCCWKWRRQEKKKNKRTTVFVRYALTRDTGRIRLTRRIFYFIFFLWPFYFGVFFSPAGFPPTHQTPVNPSSPQNFAQHPPPCRIFSFFFVFYYYYYIPTESHLNCSRLLSIFPLFIWPAVGGEPIGDRLNDPFNFCLFFSSFKLKNQNQKPKYNNRDTRERRERTLHEVPTSVYKNKIVVSKFAVSV